MTGNPFVQHLLLNLIILTTEITVFYFRLQYSAVSRTHPTAFLLFIFILLFCGCTLEEGKRKGTQNTFDPLESDFLVAET